MRRAVVWAWNDEHKVWIPERAQRPNDEEELIGKMDLFEDMERNYARACKKLMEMEKQRDRGEEMAGEHAGVESAG